ncbi:hypothetical protein HZS38_07700 [Xenorhabdus nematophila]|uniref:Uncharacterized protein n=3 Tax=Xenorhabdus nematophila TaxID=628 RepID=D3VEJ6_XENNA|nr:hypothetical protein [Xenorhabdus nematophila]CCW32102.1 conserved hypothetical protein [Xenorhabdus nematophila F1]CEE93722.1 hypothetical protein XNA1_4290001 [Xenorhabdus nematophila str. Anatoliense]CEF33221.1 hypothetical protein XNW1_4670008 [Xenorhabdus nematophila str. Websteri]AYA40369.1 hypothetical protein D3790_07810 [Xenorhabdus nematophila]AYA40377.1 hypothetical protein D3790_07855 [Xenorhabdus nematophila]
MSYRDVINCVGDRITVILVAASGTSATATINDRSGVRIFFGSGNHDRLHKVTLRYPHSWSGEETEITYEVRTTGQGIDRVFNDNPNLYFEQFGKSPFTVKVIGRK